MEIDLKSYSLTDIWEVYIMYHVRELDDFINEGYKDTIGNMNVSVGMEDISRGYYTISINNIDGIGLSFIATEEFIRHKHLFKPILVEKITEIENFEKTATHSEP